MASRMTEKGFRYAVCSLTAKRAEVAGELARLRLETALRRRELSRVDELLRILAPAVDPAKIPPKKQMKFLNLFRQGELQAVIMRHLRAEKNPLTNLQIAGKIHTEMGYGPELWNALRRRTRANLAYLEAQGRVHRTKRGPGALWTLSVQSATP